MPEFNLPYGFRILNPEQLDARFGPYRTLTEAKIATEGRRVPGLRIGVINKDNVLIVYEVTADYAFYSSMNRQDLDRDLFKNNNRLQNIAYMFSNDSANSTGTWNRVLPAGLFTPYVSNAGE